MVNFKIQTTFPVSPRIIYEAWLDSEKHSAMTRGAAQCSKEQGGSFTAWDGYITGINFKLSPHSEIIQTWRTSEFANNEKDSKLRIKIETHEKGCLLTLSHSDIPDGQSDYEQGWHDHYFAPMMAYFN
jgi:activator of HSP90 ATPase